MDKIRRWAIRALLILVFVPIIGFGLWTWASLKFVYAQGERAGYIQKISKKGWLFKTWEGELAMANLPGSMPQIFSFSVMDSNAAQDLVSRSGQRVILHYEQHRYIPVRIFGETEYFVTSVTPAPENLPQN